MNIKLSDISGVPDPRELARKDDHILIDLMPFAHIVRSCVGENVFIAPDKGLYLEHSLVPFLRYEQQFITKNIPFPITLKDIPDLSTFSESIYDLKGNLIMGFGPGFPQVFMGCPNPAIELKVVQTFVENEIYDRLRWNPRIKRNSIRDLLNLEQFAYLNPNERVVYDYEAVENHIDEVNSALVQALDGLSLLLSDFINGHTWNMYDVSHKNSITCIKRGVDYRVYEWTRIHYEHEQEKLRIARGE